MTSLFSNYYGNAILKDYFISKNTWLALHTADPGVNGDLSTEIEGGGYERQPMTWTSPNNKTIATTNSQVFTDLPAFTLSYLGIWDAVANGHLLVRFDIPNVTIPVTGRFNAITGDIAFTV